MTAERWREVKEILDALEDCPPENRAGAIAEACGGDAELRREVESLLSFETRAEIMDRSADRSKPGAPDRIGPYRIERMLGAGGMGSVFLAVRDDDQYRKEVAIKLIQWVGDAEATARFRMERQVLANLDHPNIARLLDGGALSDGQPYLVMDYIDGIPIDVFVRERALETDGVLRLFLIVCAAVQFAHRNLVIHRDLKAGNILVSADGEPHLLDFGIAKLLNPVAADIDRTQPWRQLLTPGSASPEQAAGGPITTASDVYSLGVLLYSLVTGAGFYSGARGFSEDPGRAIREYEPPLASATAGLPSRARQALAGDVDTILRKATAKDPARRYSTVEEFAADIRRHLEGHPITARPASFRYRAGKFARRNRVFVSAAALLFLSIAAGTTGTARYAYRAHLAETKSESRFEALHRLTNAMLFEVDDVLGTLQGATAARAAIVNRTLEYLDQMASDSANNSAVLQDLASAYSRIGRIQGSELTAHLGGRGSVRTARKSFEKSLAIRQRLLAGDPGNGDLEKGVLDSQWEVAETYRYEGDLDRAIAMQTEMVAKAKAVAAKSRGHDRTYVEMQYALGACLTNLGDVSVTLGQAETGLDYERQSLAVRRAIADEHPGDKRAQRVVGISHNYLALALEAMKRYPEAAAEELLSLASIEPLAAAEPRNADLKSMLAESHQHLCGELAHSGKFGEARKHCQTALDLFTAAAAADPNNIQAQEDLAEHFSALSDLADAMGKQREALAWESKARTLYRTIELKDPDAFETETEDASSLLHLGILERKLGMAAPAARDLTEARQMLAKQAKQSPKSRVISDLYDRAAAAGGVR